MKNVLLICLSLLMITACGNGAQKKQSSQTKAEDANTVYAYYFHGKQRCKTCIAVGDLAKLTIETSYAGNSNVKFIEIDTSDKTNEALVERYEVTWNALIIAKGDQSIDITKQAFANAVSNTEVLTELLKTEVNKRLQ